MLTGVDILKIQRMTRLMEKSPQAIGDIFSEGEIAYCQSRPHPAESFAARFAAKEALIKAIDSEVLEFDLSQIEVVKTKTGRPEFHITSQHCLDKIRTLTDKEEYKINLALTHEDDYAVAFVVIE
ncbi:MAG: holo-ACP synthase [Spirochaetales bacterium]|nr:holo-ACP synthase [Spirochaetales bacterium]